jgi:hypothetical protein
MPSLSETLPRLWSAACTLGSELENGEHTEWASLYQRLDFLTEGEWIDAVENVIPGWGKIATQNDGLTAKHTLVVLACCMNLPEYQNASAQTRREIEWAAIFHDLDKDVQYGRGDGSHGVRSAGVAAQRLVDLDFEFQPKGHFETWVDAVKSAQKQVDGKWVNDFSRLPALWAGLHYFFGFDTPASRILKAVMFHQSLPTLGEWPNPVILSDDEMRAYLTWEDMDVLGPLMLGDSDAWNVCESKRDAYMEELRGNIEKVRDILENSLVE